MGVIGVRSDLRHLNIVKFQQKIHDYEWISHSKKIYNLSTEKSDRMVCVNQKINYWIILRNSQTTISPPGDLTKSFSFKFPIDYPHRNFQSKKFRFRLL